MAPQENVPAENTNEYIGSIPYEAGKFLANPPPGEDLVITGLAGKYPNSHNVYEFRDNLLNKIDMVCDDTRRWDHTHPEIPKRTGKIYDVDKFDAGYFGIHHRQANSLEIITRIMLEQTIECILDAGYHPSEFEGSRTGVFIGCSLSENKEDWFSRNQEKQQFPVTGNECSMIANRISYFLKLKGPSYVIDTACSSSIYALDEAYKAIRNGLCDMAIVGGVNLCMHPLITLQFARLGVLSLDGTCKVFDEAANGYARSEAIIGILLQKSKDARRVYAQVVHSKTNCDGYKAQGINFPSKEIQQKLLREFYEECKVDPNKISYMEAHGTGTQAGDPEELNAVSEVFCKNRKLPLFIGSVKSNIGHTEPSSGLCSITKVLLSMETGLLFPNLHFKNPRKEVEDLKNGTMKVVTETIPFRDEKGMIGVNSFGFGGANGHVLLRHNEKTKINKGLPEDNLPRLVCLSGRVNEGIKSIQDDLAGRSLDVEYIRLYHEIFKRNTETYNYRGFIIVDKNGELKRSSTFYAQSRKPLYLGFTDLGDGWKNLAGKLLEFPVFKSEMQRIHDLLLKKGFNLFDSITNSNCDQLTTTLGTLSVQISLINVFKTIQVEIDGYFGSDLPCAYLDNLLSLEATLQFAFTKTPIKTTNKSSKWLDLTEKTTKLSNLSKSQILFLGFPHALPQKTQFLALTPNTDLVSFLEILGNLYEQGQDLSLSQLYPPIQFPVSRGTPMISPLIKWDHRQSWFVTSYKLQSEIKWGEECLSVRSKDNVWVYIQGHLIDGRNLFPATGYLVSVWQTFSKISGVVLADMQIVFENVKFLRATTIHNETKVIFMVMVQGTTGNFEVVEGDTVIVTGRIRQFKPDKIEQVNLPEPLAISEEEWIPMQSKDIYKELRLRGYDYKGMFKQMIECDQSASVGKIKWEDNWVSFMDNMLQMKILQLDTRNLFVPTGIHRLTIDAKKHLAFVEQFQENMELPVYVHKQSGIIKCGGIEIRGLMANAIARRKQKGEPVLEKYVFIPHETNLSLPESIRVVSQLVLENLPGIKVKCVELIDEATSENSEPVSPILLSALGDLPLIQPEITVLSKTPVEISNINVEDKKLISETDSTIAVGSKLLQRLMILKQAFGAIKENGFVVSREPLDFNPEQSTLNDIDIICLHTTQTEKLYLLRKRFNFISPKIVDVSELTEEFTWLENLKRSITSKNVIVLSQNQPLNGILGLVNCIRREPGCSHVKMVFTEGKAPSFDLTNPFYANELKKNLAINIYKNGQWGSYRHLLLNDNALLEKEHVVVLPTQRGDLSSLKWVQGQLNTKINLPSENDLISVYYCALNFKDVMIASGRINAETRDRTQQEFVIGFEYSGRTQEGNRVMGISMGALSTLITTDRYLNWSVPDFWTLEEAATVPVVYSTILYAFFVHASIKRGESILIHAGSGGIGQAAINLCLHYGLTVYTTVGTQEKRDFIKKTFPQLTDNHIGNSRDTSFEQMIYKETNGRGVDYVLNSLSEEKLIASVRCLAQGGHFLEIGRYDLSSNNPLQLALLEKDASFHGVMLDTVFNKDPAEKLVIFKLLQDGIRNGAIKPLICTVFKMNEVEQAFRYMAAGKHMGKVLINIRQEEKNRIVVPKIMNFKGQPRFSCNSEKIHVILGGLGGFGLELADWLVMRGARRLVLTSRKGITTGYQAFRIRTWQKYGTITHVSTADITTREGCEELIVEAQKIGQIESIFNLAVVLQDAILENQTVEQFKISLAPKAFATEYLDKITREQCPNLSNFVVFSSVSCGRGNSGQTNYGMANSIMERICEKRREDGLPGLAIQWGAIGDVGLVAQMQEENTELEIGGTLQQRIFNCLHVMDTLLCQNEAVVSSIVVAEKRAGTGGGDSIADAVANILGLGDLKTVSLHTSLSELGMDSMTAVEIKQTLEREYEVFLTAQDIRTLTFAKLYEIQEEKDSDVPTTKSNQPISDLNLVIQHVNSEEEAKIPVMQLKSKVKDITNAPYIIVFPGIEGVAKVLNPLVENLNARVDCLQYTNDNQVDSIQEMAFNLLGTVEKLLSNKKSFNIIGYSFGTLIALEVISLLEAKGYKGTFMAIDGSPDMMAKLVQSMMDIQSEEIFETTYLMHVASLYMPVQELESIHAKLLTAKSLDERIDYILELNPKDLTHSPSYLRAFSTAIYKRLKAITNYKPSYGTFKSDFKLFKPQNMSVLNVDDNYKLKEFCENEVEVNVFEGNHLTVLDNLEMANKINEIVEGQISYSLKERIFANNTGNVGVANERIKQI